MPAYKMRPRDANPMGAFFSTRARSSVLGMRPPVSIRYRVSGLRHPVPETWHPVPDIGYLSDRQIHGVPPPAHCPTALLPYCLIALLPYCPTALLPYCPIPPPPHCPMKSSPLPPSLRYSVPSSLPVQRPHQRPARKAVRRGTVERSAHSSGAWAPSPSMPRPSRT